MIYSERVTRGLRCFVCSNGVCRTENMSLQKSPFDIYRVFKVKTEKLQPIYGSSVWINSENYSLLFLHEIYFKTHSYSQSIQIAEKSKGFLSKKGKSGGLVCVIDTFLWQWILDNLPMEEEKTRVSKNVALKKDNEYTMDRACMQQGNHKENGKRNYSSVWFPK